MLSPRTLKAIEEQRAILRAEIVRNAFDMTRDERRRYIKKCKCGREFNGKGDKCWRCERKIK